jgi:hypothetical protein
VVEAPERLGLPDDLAACQALVRAHQRLIQEKLRQVKSLEARWKRRRRQRRQRVQELYRSYCQTRQRHARKQDDDPPTVGCSG